MQFVSRDERDPQEGERERERETATQTLLASIRADGTREARSNDLSLPANVAHERERERVKVKDKDRDREN